MPDASWSGGTPGLHMAALSPAARLALCCLRLSSRPPIRATQQHTTSALPAAAYDTVAAVAKEPDVLAIEVQDVPGVLNQVGWEGRWQVMVPAVAWRRCGER